MDQSNVSQFLDNNMYDEMANIPSTTLSHFDDKQPQMKTTEKFIETVNDIGQIPDASLVQRGTSSFVLLHPSENILYPITLFKPHVIDQLSNKNRPKVETNPIVSDTKMSTDVSKGKLITPVLTFTVTEYLPIIFLMLCLNPYSFNYLLTLPYLNNQFITFGGIALLVLLLLCGLKKFA